MEETLEMVRKAGGDGEIFECDVSKPENVQSMADYAFSNWKKVDLLINNAGVVSCGFTGDIPIGRLALVRGYKFLGNAIRLP